MACHQKHKNSNKPLQFCLLQNSCFLFQIPFKKLQKEQVHKGYPLAGPCMCNYKLELAFAIRNNLFRLTCIFFLVLPFLNFGWMVLYCDWMLFQSTDKANLYKVKKCLLQSSCLQSESNGDPIKACQKIRKQMFLNQNPMKIPSEPIRKQKFFNQNPMEIPSEPVRKERICQNFFRSLGRWSRFLIYYCESDPRPPKKKDRVGFTIVDAKLLLLPILLLLLGLLLLLLLRDTTAAATTITTTTTTAAANAAAAAAAAAPAAAAAAANTTFTTTSTTSTTSTTTTTTTTTRHDCCCYYYYYYYYYYCCC